MIFRLLIIGVLILIPSITQAEINIMTFNIRYDNPKDGINSWDIRKKSVVDTITSNDAYIVGIQEALLSQIKYLDENLTNYSYVGVARDDGIHKGEFNPIFYRRDKYRLLESDTFWLSETPDVPSLGWNAEYHRIVTWAKFKDVKSKKVFYVFNTHLDRKKRAKQQSAILLNSEVKNIAGNKPVIVTGDFNAKPNLKAYNLLTEDLIDTQALAQHIGPKKTYTGFKDKPKKRIDYIFVKGKIKIKYHETLKGKVSDHYPIIIKIKL